MPADGSRVGEVRTTGKGSRGRCTQRTPLSNHLRTTAFETRCQPALLPLPRLLTNFTPVGGRAQTTPLGSGWFRHSSGKVLVKGRQPQTFPLIKVYLGFCIQFVPHDPLLHDLYILEARRKNHDIISVRGDLFT